MALIYCVEDDGNIRELVVYTLNTTGMEARGFEDGKSFMEALAFETPELILLDIMLSGEDGLSLLKKLKNSAKTKEIPVIMVTAKGAEYDKVVGLDGGADDYVTKPFNPLELMARVKSQIRRYVSLGSMEKKDSLIVTGGLALDLDSKEITLDGEKVKLTATEYGILEYLMKNIGRVLSTNQIYEAVWKEPSFQTEKTVTVHIRRIREKIEINPKEPKYLKVVWGIGYKIEKL